VRHVSVNIPAVKKLAILGGNGSGKSTLLQLVSGYLVPTAGELVYKGEDGRIYEAAKVPSLVSFASPYLQVQEDLTMAELFNHVAAFKPYPNGLDATAFISTLEMDHAAKKYIRQFSSGMKQRVKLGLAILCDTPVLLLDEPLSNLDKAGMNWYRKMIETCAMNKTVIVSSNDMQEEFFFAEEKMLVQDYKREKV
jgi:ABC-type multidrug transport system ATPase subunit